MHREYLNPFPAKLLIERGRVRTENSNKPHGRGVINPDTFSPFPKNPNICRMFKEIGLADELGSGVRKLFKYVKIYSGGKEPILIEEDIFTVIIPIQEMQDNKAGNQVTDQVTDQVKNIIKIIGCKEKRSKEIMEEIGLVHKPTFRINYINPAIRENYIEMTIPDKPQSQNQKYRLTAKGQELLNRLKGNR